MLDVLCSRFSKCSACCLMHIAWPSPYATFMLNTNDKFKLNSLENIVKDAVDLAPF